MRLHRALYLLAAIALEACKHPPVERERLEPGVFTAVLDSLFTHDSAQRIIVRALHVQPLGWFNGARDNLRTDAAAARRNLEERGLAPALAADFVAANLSSDSVHFPIAARLPVERDTLPPVAPALRDSILRHGRSGSGFERVARAYPGARYVIQLSRAGFSPDGRGAVIYVASWCGMLCADGVLVSLHLERGRWVITLVDHVWVS